MKTVTRLIYLLLITHSLVTHAHYSKYSEFCQDNKDYTALSDSIYLDFEQGEDFECRTIKLQLEAISQISTLSPIKFPPISLNITEESWDASNLINLMNFPEKFIHSNTTDEYVLNSQLTKNYIAHEYGHSIFVEYIARDFPELLYSINRIKNHNMLGNKIKFLKTHNGHIEAQKLEFIYERQDIEIFTDSKVMNPIKHIVAMSELFSDLVSVLYAQDLQAFSKAAAGQFPTHDQINEYKPRDFSQYFEVEKWSDSEAHNLYAPIRSYIGSQLTFPMSHKNRRHIIRRMLEIMSKELVQTYGKQDKESVIELNKRLLYLIKNQKDIFTNIKRS